MYVLLNTRGSKTLFIPHFSHFLIFSLQTHHKDAFYVLISDAKT